jgi:hypothetical protein
VSRSGANAARLLAESSESSFRRGLMGSALLGAGSGAGSAKIGKETLKSDQLWDAAKDLEPGTSVSVAVVEVEWIEQIQKARRAIANSPNTHWTPMPPLLWESLSRSSSFRQYLSGERRMN